MFDHRSGSGGLNPLWLLASVALGTSLGATQCSSAQAQPIDLSLSHEAGTTQDVEDTPTSNRHVAGEAPGRAHPRWVEDLESKAWPGFLTGLSGYEDFVMPVGMPMYFEDPLITTDLRLLYIHHKIPGGSSLRWELTSGSTNGSQGGESQDLTPRAQHAVSVRSHFP